MPQRRKTYLCTCAPSEDSDQPAHSHRLIRIFTGRILDHQLCNVFMRTSKTLIRLHDAQSDLGLRLAHTSEGTLSHVAIQPLFCNNKYAKFIEVNCYSNLRVSGMGITNVRSCVPAKVSNPSVNYSTFHTLKLAMNLASFRKSFFFFFFFFFLHRAFLR